ncbi:MAG: hypothetical protein K1X70_01910 [Leptospirales bacterium]|nr:hypothetical protein [Leptospirales bacterium]HMU84232.1 hypothetical protein [Leptospiraceae bacterium]HMW58142.1 hypothetical protein [Leptospiraceae bacterium]HNE22684.1 hypothetical protein [Leptospiraceae bacterium]HNJ03066.1 hypothetical protein [Leptospiraceae bacterium]
MRRFLTLVNIGMSSFARVFILLFASALHADTVLLVDGRLLEGKYLGDRGDFIEWEQAGQIVKLESTNVVRIELAYPGVPVCFRRKGAKERVCQGKLYLLYGSSVEIIGGPGDTKKETVKISDLSDLEFQRTTETQLLLPRIRPGAAIRLVIPEGSVQGSVQSVEPGRVLVRDSQDQVVEVREEKIEQLQLPTSSGFLFSRLIPGLPQYRRSERIKSGAIVGGIAFFGMSALWEQSQAQREVSRARANLLYISTGIGSRESVFAGHRKNAQILGFGMLLTYGFHLTDEFVLSARSSRKSIQIGFSFPLALLLE